VDAQGTCSEPQVTSETIHPPQLHVSIAHKLARKPFFQMHSLTYIKISNFRSCLSTELSINEFTPIVGYNNAGKSTILSAIEWLLAPTALTCADFNVSDQPLLVEGKVVGIVDAILDAMPNNHAQAIRPYLADGEIRIRRKMPIPGTAATAKL
jgi:putative ATP-dependent endonuclease of OLD family